MIDCEQKKLRVKDVIELHFKSYGMERGPFTEAQTIRGARVFLQNEMRRLNMKYSLATNNAVRYRWLCQHYISSEMKHADPSNYHTFPFVRFWNDHRFYAFFLGFWWNVLCNSNVQFILAMVLVYFMHKWSHSLYMVPLPLTPVPCYKMPFQPLCKVLQTIQHSTFESIDDASKTITVFIIKLVFDFLGMVINLRQFTKKRS
jgi:hypothetical protein